MGKKPQKQGRRPLGYRGENVTDGDLAITVRFSRSQGPCIRRAAKRAGVTVSRFMREAALDAADGGKLK